MKEMLVNITATAVIMLTSAYLAMTGIHILTIYMQTIFGNEIRVIH